MSEGSRRWHSCDCPDCTVFIAADSEKDLLEAAVPHAVTVHGHQDNEERRKTLSTLFKVGASKP
ncbi:DUF1059 domain-containing protein [Candidatus Accumulibacter necessarius]|uniref:DUF1059 domain-containing protein n=1 Tax=Candidatus Accumulibacter necessarius TaxID=2954386 RepID=UPI003DA93AE0